VLNAAAVVLTGYGNVPPERAAQVMGMLLGVPVSPGWMDKASARLAAQPGKAGFDEAMLAALAGQDALAADETPVNVPGKNAPQPAGREEGRIGPGRQGEGGCGRPARADRPDPGRAADLAAGPDLAAQGRCRRGHPGRVHRAADDRRLHRLPALLSRLAGIQQCCQHIIRRCRAVIKLGPGGLQSWAGDIIAVLREAHQAVQDARARGSTALGADLLDKLRQRYDDAVAFGITHNRLRDWHEGNHPGYALGCWLRDYKEQVFLFTRDFAVDWTTNVAERGAKPPSAIRPSPATGTRSPPSPAGTASGAAWTPPPPTASRPSTPSGPPSKADPGYHRPPP
jgi:hypothetical protein